MDFPMGAQNSLGLEWAIHEWHSYLAEK